MVHALIVPQTAVTADELAERVQTYVATSNLAPFIAAERVIDDLCREGRQDDLLRFLGPAPLFEVWQEARQRKAPKNLHALARGRETQRINREALKRPGALLDTLVEIGGVWRRLGDLSRADCLRAAGVEKRRALRVAQRARWYHAIAQTLADGEVVQQKHDEMTLAQLFEAAGR